MSIRGISVLKSIESLGGKAELKQIYEWFLGSRTLTEESKRITDWKEPAYEHRIRAHISILWRKKGELKWVSESCYSLTKKGTKRLEAERRKKITKNSRLIIKIETHPVKI